jgi:hypothetical protein
VQGICQCRGALSTPSKQHKSTALEDFNLGLGGQLLQRLGVPPNPMEEVCLWKPAAAHSQKDYLFRLGWCFQAGLFSPVVGNPDGGSQFAITGQSALRLPQLVLTNKMTSLNAFALTTHGDPEGRPNLDTGAVVPEQRGFEQPRPPRSIRSCPKPDSYGTLATRCRSVNTSAFPNIYSAV